MEWVETTAKSVEAAKDAALDQLGVDEHDAEFDVVEEPRTGLFGRVRGEARVRARIAPRPQRPKQERRRTGATRKSKETRKPKGAGKGDDTGKGEAADPPGDTAPVRGSGDASKAKRAKAKRTTVSEERDQPIARTSKSTEPSVQSRTASAEEGKRMDDSVTVEEQSEIMESFLADLLDVFGTTGTITSEKVDDDTIEINITGDDLGLLIGPKGQTLEAVQDLARTVVQRQATGRHLGRVRVDIGGYRYQRREALGRFAAQVADQVRDTGSAKSLEPMNAADRKVVHDTVNEIDGVETRSDGQDPDRWVVILPVGE